MNSHLTRHVFRRLLANEPIVHRGCLRRQAYRTFAHSSRARRVIIPHNGHATSLQHQQRRGFLNFIFGGKKREEKEVDIDPGIEKMMELAQRQNIKARLPPAKEVAEAFATFFQNKLQQASKPPITDTQAQLALRSLRFCQENDSGEGRRPLIGTHLLRLTARVLSRTPHPQGTDALDLARIVHETVMARSKHTKATIDTMKAYVKLLGHAKSAQAARDLVLAAEVSLSGATSTTVNPLPSPAEDDVVNDQEEALEDQRPAHGGEINHSQRMIDHAWPLVLQAFVREGNPEQVQNIYAMIVERGIQRSSLAVPSTMLDFSFVNGSVEDVNHFWSELQGAASSSANWDTRRILEVEFGKVLRWCLMNDELTFGHALVKDAMVGNPQKPIWDAVFIWAAGTKKSVDEIERMMGVMEKSNESIADPEEWRIPDNATINGLVEFAISKNDPYMAERFIALGRDRQIEPDARTYVLQMDYRLSVDDVDGALNAYKNLQSRELPSSNSDEATVNRLIVALCKTQRHDFDTIMNVTADLSDRKARFEPLTVSHLSLLHLNRDELDDVRDLLNTHAFHFSSAERDIVRDRLVTFCLDPSTPISRSWPGYMILTAIFDETPRSQRTDLMVHFFARQRADMGVRVFQNMRQHSRTDTIPTVDTYVAAFMALAKLRDLESLEVVHNLLKIDYNINVTTYLTNALIVAYTASGKPRKALGFWDDIVASKEGPSYNSILVSLRAAEKSPFGDLQAKNMWALLQRRNVDLDHNLWCAYIAALAGNGDINLATEALEAAVENGDVEVDAFMLGSIYAAAPNSVKKTEVERWAREVYGEVWERLEGMGSDVDAETGARGFRIDRSVAP